MTVSRQVRSRPAGTLRGARRLMLLLLTLLGAAWTSPVSATPGGTVKSLKITVLSTMLADRGIGEWGYAALVEADGRKILFDTGARPETVLKNAEELGIDLSEVEDVVLSHHHGDHTGGLARLREALSTRNPRALARAHVAQGFFLVRARANGAVSTGLAIARSRYEAAGGRFIVHDKPVEIAPGVWFSGPVTRVHPERNYVTRMRIETEAGLVPDTIPEDASLLIRTAEGIAVLTGCGHAGIINISDHARRHLGTQPVIAVIGGLHLFDSTNDNLAWTAAELKKRGLRYLLAGHCTGIEATFVLRRLAGLDRRSAVVSAVGSSFSLKDGINPLSLAR